MNKYRNFKFSEEDHITNIGLEADIKNLLEFIRRVRDEGKWSVDGLEFCNVSIEDLFGFDYNLNKSKR